MSPDGRAIIFQLYRDGGWVLDVASGAMRRVLADPSAEEFAWSADGHGSPITAGNPARGASGSRPSGDAVRNTPHDSRGGSRHLAE